MAATKPSRLSTVKPVTLTTSPALGEVVGAVTLPVPEGVPVPVPEPVAVAADPDGEPPEPEPEPAPLVAAGVPPEDVKK